MKIIFCSTIVDSVSIEPDKSRAVISFADSNFNRCIIKGLDSNSGAPIKLFNYLPVGSYPQYKKIIFHTKNWKHCEAAEDLNVGFINISGLKYISLGLNYTYKLNKYVKNSEENICIICYDFFLPFLYALNYIKKNKNVKTCLIAPDIPIYQPISKGIKTYFLKKFGRMQMKQAQKLDSFVILTEYMKQPLKINLQPSVVIEGIAPFNDSFDTFDNTINTQFILYSGKLDRIYNIDKLLDAMNQLQNMEMELWLCGHGDMVNKIKKISKTFPRIKYLGYLSTEKIKLLQHQATMLINPRSYEGEYTKYSFPSKTMEYLVSGTPVVGFKLPGIPDEYDKYIHYIARNSTREICETIQTVYIMCQNGEAQKIGNAAKLFVMEEKNFFAQGKKIYEMLHQMF